MISRIDKRLAELGLILPPVTAPLFSYQPVVIARGFAYVAGQPPLNGAGSRSSAASAPTSASSRARPPRACRVSISWRS